MNDTMINLSFLFHHLGKYIKVANANLTLNFPRKISKEKCTKPTL